QKPSWHNHQPPKEVKKIQNKKYIGTLLSSQTSFTHPTKNQTFSVKAAFPTLINQPTKVKQATNPNNSSP
ncbi:hypothetical protein ACTXN7_12395, partial [Corynebacterium flavescens]